MTCGLISKLWGLCSDICLKKCDWIAETEGRNLLPVTVEAILSGGHARAGMKDSIFMYPQNDDLIKRTADVVTKVRRIAEELGREIATPNEAEKFWDWESKFDGHARGARYKQFIESLKQQVLKKGERYDRKGRYSHS